ncbi:MAG: B12-binding domain-containing radical SAM protein [Chloroflexi bacterium]|nr:B12-binding domain-containing radical SAM protein [Chloroflexota bacterium]
MKLMLIAPAISGNRRKLKKVLVPPLGLGMIAALTPPDVEVSLIDENVAAIDFQEDTDLVGITVLTITAQRAYEIADIFRDRGIKVVLGGIHASFLPDEASQHADSVVIGEAEETWPRLIADFKANRLQKKYEQGERKPLNNLPVPRRDLFARGSYLIKNTLAATRGCPYSCSFCSVSSFFGRTYRCRPVQDVISELDTFDGGKYFFFVDDNIIGNTKFAKELFRAMIPYKIQWFGQASVTIAKDDELLELAAASGCIGLLMGFESISPANLASVGKKINIVDEYQAVIRKIHSKGIGIHGFFITGLDGDKEDIFERTVRFAQKMKLESAGFAYPMPLPGTEFYDSMDKEGRIITKEWSRYADEIVFEPKLMSRQMLRRGHKWASQEFFRLPSILKRLGLARRNLGLLWAINLGWRAHYSQLR